jgi:hypothetical protein
MGNCSQAKYGPIELRSVATVLWCALAVFSGGSAARATIANWDQPTLDFYFYEHANSGSGTPASTFINELTVNPQTQQFEPKTADDPARFGNVMVAFNTGTQITTGRAASRYVINSVKLSMTLTYPSESSPRVLYADQPISQQQILNEVSTGTVTRRRPMELYGTAFRAGYTGFDLTNMSLSAPLMSEKTGAFSGPGSSYIAYPIVGSGTVPGAYVDVMNSVSGGFSETAPGHATAPFTPTPWAIGEAHDPVSGSEVTVGQEIPDQSIVTFTLDSAALDASGARSYVQQSLSDGALGLFVSSLHSTGEMGAGGGYPKWYLKESTGFPAFLPLSVVPKLEVDYVLLQPVPGDYDDNGSVDAADYVLWRNGGPLHNQVDDPDQVNFQDYLAWQSRFGNVVSGAGSALDSNSAVPEPTAIGSAMAGVWVVLVSRTLAGRSRG